MTESSRINNIDALRGLASLSVCWFHMTNGYSPNSLVRSSGEYGWLGVEVFFVISGFVIPYSLSRGGYRFCRDWKTFMWKRVLRIEPPYLLAMLLALTLWYVSSVSPGFQGQKPDISLAQVMLHIGYLNGIAGYTWLNPVFWSLAIEFQFYLLVAIIFGLIGSRSAGVLFTSNCLLLALSLIIVSDLLVFHFLGLFLLGIVGYQYRFGLIGMKSLILFMLMATINVWLTHGLPVALVCLVTSATLLGNVPLGSKPFLFLGAISYSLYLVHVPIGGRVINLGKRYVESQGGEAILSLAGVLTSVVVAYFFYRIIEKPSQAIASRFKYEH